MMLCSKTIIQIIILNKFELKVFASACRILQTEVFFKPMKYFSNRTILFDNVYKLRGEVREKQNDYCSCSNVHVPTAF